MPRKGDAAFEEYDSQPEELSPAEETDVYTDDLETDDPEEEGIEIEDGAALLNERIARLEAEVLDWKDRAQRAVAEISNVRQRSARDADEAISRANERFVTDLLPVLDNFTRAIEAAEQFNDVESVKNGVSQIHRQLLDVVTRHGLVRIEALGLPFDPNYHEAIMQVEAEGDQGPNEIVEELRPGYMLNDRVIRPPLVKVTAS